MRGSAGEGRAKHRTGRRDRRCPRGGGGGHGRPRPHRRPPRPTRPHRAAWRDVGAGRRAGERGRGGRRPRRCPAPAPCRVALPGAVCCARGVRCRRLLRQLGAPSAAGVAAVRPRCRGARGQELPPLAGARRLGPLPHARRPSPRTAGGVAAAYVTVGAGRHRLRHGSAVLHPAVTAVRGRREPVDGAGAPAARSTSSPGGPSRWSGSAWCSPVLPSSSVSGEVVRASGASSCGSPSWWCPCRCSSSRRSWRRAPSWVRSPSSRRPVSSCSCRSPRGSRSAVTTCTTWNGSSPRRSRTSCSRLPSC